jgi:pyrroline-5-carboxylate reductase
MAITGPVLLVGGGRMGTALLAGWLGAGLPAEGLWLVEPDTARRAAAAALAPLRAVATPAELPPGPPAVLVLAVKPQVMDEVAPAYADRLGPTSLVLSIAAGRTLASFARIFGPARPVVRAMPNTPAAIGRGITALVANEAADAAARATAEALLRPTGETLWLEAEEAMHAVTALSGGGPAYVALLVEALAAGGRGLGLEAALAERLARVTVAGSGELLHRASESPAELRRAVTSPGGTTERALAVLMAADGLEPLVGRALAAAAARSRELG